MKSIITAGNPCYYPVQTLLSSRLFSKNLKNKIYKTIILPVALYGCEARSRTLREKCRLRVVENRILRRIFGPKRNASGEWRRLNYKELHRLYRSPNIVRLIKFRRLRWVDHLVRMEEGMDAFKISTGRPAGNTPLRVPRRRCRTILKCILKK